jgi:hypothetical protein
MSVLYMVGDVIQTATCDAKPTTLRIQQYVIVGK